MVSSLTRKARATACVVSPHTSRSVNATCASALAVSQSMILVRKTTSRRIRSTALLRPALISQARGLAGTPVDSHCSMAAVNASWRASSAKSKSPSRRINVARTRPASRRKTSSTTRSMGPTLMDCAATERLRLDRPDRPYLDASIFGAGDARRDGGGCVEVLRLDLVVPAGLGKWSIGHGHLAVADSHGGGRGRGPQPVGRLEMAGLDDSLGKLCIFRRH